MNPVSLIPRIGLLVLATAALACAQPAVEAPFDGTERIPTGVTGDETLLGGGEGWQGVFQGLPDSLTSSTRISAPGETGEPLRISGRVLHLDGSPASGVVIYAYHTNSDGVYPPASEFRGQAAYHHGQLRGWAISDDQSRYRFDTIRPGSYPDTENPQHVHMYVIEPGRCIYWIDSIHFSDDPYLTDDLRERFSDGRGGSGLVTPRKQDGVWVVRRDIHLGRNVPGYE